VSEKVIFPIEGLDMRPYVITLQHEPEPVLYDLCGVSNHFGSLNGGHYTAYVKNMLSG
jgi:ubiquitin carboxyl-terminal hydrolase 4/11/15